MHSRFYLSLLLISGLLVISYLGLTAYHAVMPEWKYYQAEYKDLVVKNAKDDATRKRAMAMTLGFKQVYLKDLKREDRCINCHAGVDNPLMEGAKVPFKKHSGNYLVNHPVDKFGCTVCHDGQSFATNEKEAHGKGHETHWDYPILPLKYVQSSCAQCHDFNMLAKNGGEKVAKGEELFREKGCKGCHKIDGVGGDIGKALDGVGNQPIAYFPMKHVIGERTVFNWLKQHFVDPRALVAESAMKVKLAAGEDDLLTTYALSLKSEEMPKKYRRINYANPPKYDGEALYKMYCSACHEDGDKTIYDEVFKRTVPAIKNPSLLRTMNDANMDVIVKEGRAGTQMTAWKSSAAGLSDEQIKEIIGYLALKRPAEQHEPFGLAAFTGDVKHGKEVYEVNCSVCHGKDAKGGENLLGISLRSPVVQKKIDTELLAVTIADGRAGTSMPPFIKDSEVLTKQDVADVVAFIKEFPSAAK
ncbi:c-type cytochrome [Candidatus Magnetomonas plexicatena]|uniref:c-type cytochrome n=1 Tax=Candidatus Magnetomonas plexicatena TaxID=2552947 RepID=UPI001C7618DB|nr:c-type cytochrome [Nitrospirales bacterium LBB_01]